MYGCILTAGFETVIGDDQLTPLSDEREKSIEERPQLPGLSAPMKGAFGAIYPPEVHTWIVKYRLPADAVELVSTASDGMLAVLNCSVANPSVTVASGRVVPGPMKLRIVFVGP